MSEEAQAAGAVEEVTEAVKDVKLENGNAPGALNGTPTKEDEAIPFKVPTDLLPTASFVSGKVRLWCLYDVLGTISRSSQRVRSYHYKTVKIFHA